MTPQRERAAQQCAAVLDGRFFKAFAEPARVQAFQKVVLLGTADIGAIAEGLPQDRSVVSRHLQVLADAGVLKVRKAGRHVLYEVAADEIEARLLQMLELTRALRTAGGSCDANPLPECP